MTLSHSQRRLESNADRMINRLFNELDPTLEHYRSPQTQDTTADNNHTAEEIEPNVPFIEDPLDGLEFDSLWEEEVDEPPKPSPVWTHHLDKIIFFSSCSLFIGSLLLVEQNRQFSFQNWQDIQSAMIGADRQEVTPPDLNAEFLTYMGQALEEISREEAQAQNKKQQPLQPVTVKSPQPEAAPSPQPSPAVSALPALPPPPPKLQNPQPPIANPEPKPAATETSQDNTATPASHSAPKEPSAPVSEAEPEITKTAPQTLSHQLVGLLELGEHSAALLKVEGATQRVMLEEPIPGTNWKLISVANQTATFENKEQQKVIFVGEKMSLQ